ncbi:TorF family putative porin [Roseateles sp. BYS96W]|uniref:TorF family putative porin n=1 Tax=Pelomonas nitida TaxID=3299027 RepID=A0ABW7G8R7_9BURK
MKLSPTLLALALSAVVMPAFADEPAPADPLSFNVGVVSEYRYRGISQSRLKPALQGGIDYAAPSGFYVGTWASTIKWIKDAGGDSQVEVDVYGGYKTEVSKGLTLDVGLLQYYYPSNKLATSANTLEAYGALSFGPVTAKYSHSTSNLFGFPDSKGSGYFDVTANFDLGNGMTLTPHVGHQTVKHLAIASYTDYSVTLAKDFSGLVLSGAVIGTDADKSAYASPANGKFMGKTMLVVGLKKTF